MKTGFYTRACRVFKCVLTIAVLLCFAPGAQAQYIPIDSGFAIALTNSGLSSCISNYQLDTVCAKAYNNNLYLSIDVDTNHRPKSLEGLQYIGKDRVGLPVLGRQFSFNEAEGVTYIPDLPSIYSWVAIYGANSLAQAPYVGDSVVWYGLEGTGIQTIGTIPGMLRELHVQQTAITQLPALPSTLTHLSFAGSNLSTLPTLAVGIKMVIVNDNQLTSLPALPASITHLQCQRNNLTTLPALPVNLNLLSCDSNHISALPQLPARLQVLNCSGNNLSSLPVLPDTLVSLVCSYNPLTVLPEIPAELEALYCDHCQLTVLPELAHTNIYGLRCGHNNLRVLPALPPNSTIAQPWDMDVDASNNQLDSITNFPAHLTWFRADNNNLFTLPAFNNRLPNLSLTNNHIAILPSLPSGLRSFKIDSNPIVCLPFLPDTIIDLSCTHTGITCIPNRPLTLQSNLPVCTQGYDCYTAGIGGRVYIDRNNNCVFDTGDFTFKNCVLRLAGHSYYTKTDSSGRYNFIVPSGNYQIELPGLPYPYTPGCNGSATPVTYNGIDHVDTINFAITPLAECAMLQVDISTALIRVGMPNTHYAMVTNGGTQPAQNVVLKIKFEPELIPLSSQPAWQQQLPGNIIIYNLGLMVPGDQVQIFITDSTSITTLVGQTACVMAAATAGGTCTPPAPAWDSSDIKVQAIWVPGDDSIHFVVKNMGKPMSGPSQYRIYEEELLMMHEPFQLTGNDSLIAKTPANGHTYRIEADQMPSYPGKSKPRDFIELAGTPPFSLHLIVPIPQDDEDDWIEIDCHEIRNALDPNEKQVFPSGVGVNHYITATDELEYILHFQNTGNDTAFNIRLIDTLSTTVLDATTFKSGVSSHPYTVSMRGNGIVEWKFTNILLVDSTTNEPGSHGFVKFKIKQVAGNTPGTVINNFVDIYFDYNAPVRTNTAFVTIEEKENIFPVSVIAIKPETGYSIHVMPNPFANNANFEIATENTKEEQYTFELFDMLGRRLVNKPVNSRFVLNRNDIDAGVYMFRLTTKDKLIGSGKIVAR